MSNHKLLNLILSLMIIASLILGGSTPASAQKAQNMPTGPHDESKVPHYYGPWPNWANSPFTLPDAIVEIDPPCKNGCAPTDVTATAEATVGANGAITGITITNPGSGYTSNPKVVISNTDGTNTSASATATYQKKSGVVAVNVDQPGSGYTTPDVTFSGNGGAAATAYGGVDAIAIADGGFGYQFPTVDFDMPDDPNGVQASGHADFDPNTGAITAVVVDHSGSGYSTAPKVVVRDGTQFDPINHDPDTFAAAVVTATLSIQSIVMDNYGSGYNAAPSVTISDLNGSGAGAAATAVIEKGIITAITLDPKKPGSGYLTTGGIKKFTDALPGLCAPPDCPSYLLDPVGGPKAKYIPLAVPEVKTYNGIEADEYVIGLVQYRTSFSSSMPDTLVRGYIQLETAANVGISQHYPVTNELIDGTQVPINKSDGNQWLAVTPPQWLGPTIAATKNRPVRIVFYNLLPTGSDGDLFLPTDSSMMGSGMGPTEMGMEPTNQNSVMDGVRNPACSEFPKDGMNCFVDNRATLHLHGGISPWISDGTPHQWITPAKESTMWPEGVSVQNVPDMNVCGAADDGCQTFYYTNQQSARLMFYHDHAWGITRLNVYAGEAAGYLISDDTEQALLSSGAIPTDQIPLIVQDRTFVPDAAQLALQDPTWDVTRWGAKGSFWYHHVYMPAQNPGDPSGMSAYGRWMYGPWFWPPALNTKYGPIQNPYFDPGCNLDDPATWQYDTDPFCEPAQIPGTPNISVGMEQFNDTPTVNGVAYPTLTLEPKSYRFRVLSVANDRFFNFQWYVADPDTASTDVNTLGQVIGGTEVALNPAELAAAQLDPNVFPTPVQGAATTGPDWIQIGTEGGFLPAPVVVDGQQPTTWITDPTRFDVGNVDKHSLLLAPAERADVIVDFSKFAGKTLILYNDAPAAFPARVASYDYYTGAPDLSPVGAPSILPGYGPNTRTIMQVKIAPTASSPVVPFSLSKLQAAFRHNANGTGVFESGQHPIIVGQAAYNSAYGLNFASGSNCNAPGNTTQRCDGYVRVNDTQQFSFNTLLDPNTKMTLPLQPKAIHDEMNSSTFDEFGRMTANLGVEAQPPVPGAQNVVLYPYVNPATELIDATNLPKNVVTYDANGKAVNDIKITPISQADDGTQLWRITHNGVDTHPIHWHLYDVQLVNRVTWDNIIIPPDATELGWKDTIRIAPLEDTIVALRPIIPQVPFEVPNAVRPLNPMMPLGSTAMFNSIDPQGNPTAAVVNQLVNFGWEYVFHCHILSHEEMDMMRPVSVALPPIAPDGLAFDAATGTLLWNDNSITETAFRVERSVDGGANWAEVATIPSPLDLPNVHELRSQIDGTFDPNVQNLYRVVALNTVGYLDGNDPLIAGFPEMTVQSVSETFTYDPNAAPEAPVLTAAYQPDAQIVLNWSNIAGEAGYNLERSTDGATFDPLITLGADVTTYTDTPVAFDSQYFYRVYGFDAINVGLPLSNTVPVVTPPVAPDGLTAAYQFTLQVVLNWNDTSSFEDGFIITRIDGDVTSEFTVGPNVTSYTDTGAAFDAAYVYTVSAYNVSGTSAPSAEATVDMPPFAPNNLSAAFEAGPQVVLTWFDNSEAETDFAIERCANVDCTDFARIATAPALTAGIGWVSYTDTTVALDTAYRYRVAAEGPGGLSDYSNIFDITTSVQTIPAVPSNLSVSNATASSLTLNWLDTANEDGFTVELASNAGFTKDVQSYDIGANLTSYTFGGLTASTKYYLRVQAYNAAGASAWAPTISGKTLK